MMKLTDADLRISGYASLFGQVDLGGDTIMAGAFAASILKLKQGRLPMLYGHETAQPIGVWDRITEDQAGLFVSGYIIQGTKETQRLSRLIKDGALSGLSIGYRVIRQNRSARGRALFELDLWEVSVVAFPMQRDARITQIDTIPNLLPASHPI